MSFSELAALTIHDVKNNLAQLAADAELRGDIASVRVALNASETLSRLLCFYKSESHSLSLHVEAQSPQELIDDLLHALPRTIPEQNKIHLSSDLSLAPAIWFYDKVLIQMVLANALQNALRYAKTSVEIGVTLHATHLEFCVQDDGAGYPQSVLEEVVSGGQSAVSQHGTGLGLRLAQSVVSMHQNQGRAGEIFLSNEQGARFSLRLP
jgi:K+-sensing histidine kinase KdpD